MKITKRVPVYGNHVVLVQFDVVTKCGDGCKRVIAKAVAATHDYPPELWAGSRGKSVCSPDDEFNLKKGITLARLDITGRLQLRAAKHLRAMSDRMFSRATITKQDRLLAEV